MNKQKPSDLIRQARETAGLTQAQAGEATGFSRSAIQKFEAGRRTPRASALPVILRNLKGAKP